MSGDALTDSLRTQPSKGSTVTLLDEKLRPPSRKKAGAIGGAIALAAASLAIALPNLAIGDTVKPWQLVDPNAQGTLVFYDASGAAVTSGSINAPIAAFVKGATIPRTGDTTASLYAYSPTDSAVASTNVAGFGNHPTYAGAWSGQLLSTSTISGSYPGSIGTGAVETVGSSGVWTVANIATAFPHTGDSAAVQGVYEIRLRTSGPTQPIPAGYDAAYIAISGGTWSVIDTATFGGGGTGGGNGGGNGGGGTTITKTTPTVTAVSSTPKPTYGKAFNVTITVPSGTGVVTLTSGSKALGTSTLANGSVKITVSATALTAGAKTLTASFAGSTTLNAASGTVKVAVQKAKPTLTLKLAKASVKKSAKPKVTLTVKATGITAVTGKVKIYDGKKVLKTVTLTAKNKGKVVITLAKFAKTGTHKLKATYTASTNIAANSSKVVNQKVVR
jgi:hypothetical protein